MAEGLDVADKVAFNIPMPDFSGPASSALLRVFVSRLPGPTLFSRVQVNVLFSNDHSVPAASVPVEEMGSDKWLVFNVTEAVNSWAQVPAGKQATAGRKRQLLFGLLPSKNAGRSQGASVSEFLSVNGNNLPTLTLFQSRADIGTSPAAQPEELMFKLSEFEARRRHKRSANSLPKGNRWAKAMRSECKLHSFKLTRSILLEYMNITLISPKSFDFSLCLGQCKLPLIAEEQRDRASANALIRSLILVKKAKMVSPPAPFPPAACCAVKHGRIDFVILVDTIYLVPVGDITVTACGCR